MKNINELSNYIKKHTNLKVSDIKAQGMREDELMRSVVALNDGNVSHLFARELIDNGILLLRYNDDDIFENTIIMISHVFGYYRLVDMRMNTRKVKMFKTMEEFNDLLLNDLGVALYDEKMPRYLSERLAVVCNKIQRIANVKINSFRSDIRNAIGFNKAMLSNIVSANYDIDTLEAFEKYGIVYFNSPQKPSPEDPHILFVEENFVVYTLDNDHVMIKHINLPNSKAVDISLNDEIVKYFSKFNLLKA